MIKKMIFVWILLLIIYLIFDSRLYYLGIGNGFISQRLPKPFTPLFADSDFGGQGFILVESSAVDFFIVEKNQDLYLNNGSIINIKNINGYWFNNNFILVFAIDVNGDQVYLKVYKNTKVQIEKISFLSSQRQDANYIDLSRDFTYYQRLKLLFNLFQISFSVLSGYLIFRVFKKRLVVCKEH